jgi:hypothetical protein
VTDPKLDKLPTDAKGDFKERPEGSSPEDEQREGARRPRPGLSINDTIAANANLSVGSRGVDTSGVLAGSGAGAGTSHLTPGGRGGSPAPNIVPGAEGTGTTPRSDTAPGQNPTVNLDAEGPTRDEIAARAYRCWHERGCPEGSPEEDWRRAEQELRAERQHRSRSAPA